MRALSVDEVRTLVRYVRALIDKARTLVHETIAPSPRSTVLARRAELEKRVDCCTSHCNDGVCGPGDSCSKLGERCTSSDGCDASNVCIGGYCSVVLL